MAGKLELSLTRFVAAAPDAAWNAMIDRIEEWRYPRPLRAKIVALDWRSGPGSASF